MLRSIEFEADAISEGEAHWLATIGLNSLLDEAANPKARFRYYKEEVAVGPVYVGDPDVDAYALDEFDMTEPTTTTTSSTPVYPLNLRDNVCGCAGETCAHVTTELDVLRADWAYLVVLGGTRDAVQTFVADLDPGRDANDDDIPDNWVEQIADGVPLSRRGDFLTTMTANGVGP